ncbi:MAG TPA: hypothetical protein VKB19_13225, partial [Pedobacter sp.]|nr:hypothetical protein [Pedobacter sp.]
LDHTNILGTTLPEIAMEKAGIIKNKIPVVIGETHAETKHVFLNKAKETGSELLFADQQLHIEDFQREREKLRLSVSAKGQDLFEDLDLDLTGSYQLKNILTVLQSVLTMRKLGYQIADSSLRVALANVKPLTGLQGRWQTLSTDPLVICDTGHNVAGMTEVIQNISAMAYEQLHIVIGMVKDKDISGVLALLPPDAKYYFCQPDLERAMNAEDLARAASAYDLHGKVYKNVVDALDAAKNTAGKTDLIFVGGSTFVVAEVL